MCNCSLITRQPEDEYAEAHSGSGDCYSADGEDGKEFDAAAHRHDGFELEEENHRERPDKNVGYEIIRGIAEPEWSWIVAL